MTPMKRHRVGAPEIVQVMGLLILVDLDYKYFGPGPHVSPTLSAMAVLAAGLFMLVWPMSLKARQ